MSDQVVEVIKEIEMLDYSWRLRFSIRLAPDGVEIVELECLDVTKPIRLRLIQGWCPDSMFWPCPVTTEVDPLSEWHYLRHGRSLCSEFYCPSEELTLKVNPPPGARVCEACLRCRNEELAQLL